jgi:NADH-quinone oxidoreductase subunit N
MVSSTDWLVVFLGLEVLSVASYALTGLMRSARASSEAAAKYFLMGSFAGAFFVFGLALIYGTSGSMDFAGSLSPAVSASGLPAAGAVGLGLIPPRFLQDTRPFPLGSDVYEGAPTPVTAFRRSLPAPGWPCFSGPVLSWRRPVVFLLRPPSVAAV